MKTMKKQLVAMILAAVVLFAGIVTVGGMSSKKADALSPASGGQTKRVYCFTDFYPTMDNEMMITDFPSSVVTYDHQYVDEYTFEDMVLQSRYFEQYRTYDVVVIDIKTFKPSSQTLYELFSMLKQSQTCQTAFVTVYDWNDFGSYALQYVDTFIKDTFSRLDEFIESSLGDFEKRNSGLKSTCFFIDDNLVNVDVLRGADLETVCQSSVFIKHFMNKLIGIVDGKPIDYEGRFNSEANALRKAQVMLLVPTVGDHFVDLLTWQDYGSRDFYQTDNPSFQRSCGIGFSRLNTDFYNFLYTRQTLLGADAFPVYLLEAEPFATGSGLVVHSTSSKDVEPSQGLLMLLDWLHSVL